MNKKYIVRLSDAERRVCDEVVKKLKGTSQKVRRAQVLLKADADGPGWSDEKICEAYGCRVQTVENARKRFVREGFELALDGVQRQTPPTEPLLDGKAEAKVIALGWENLRPGMVAGRCGCSRNRSWNWRSSSPSVTKPFARF